MSNRSQEISHLLFARELHKRNFNDQINIGANWSITTDVFGSLHIKHKTAGADIKINDIGALETAAPIKTTDGIIIGDLTHSCSNVHDITELNLSPCCSFIHSGNFTIVDQSDNTSLIQYFDVAADASIFAYAAKLSSHDVIKVGSNTNEFNYDNNFAIINPIETSTSAKINGLAINHNGSLIAALLTLRNDDVNGTYIRFYKRENEGFSNLITCVVDNAASYMTHQIMFSGNGQYICIGLPTYKNGAGAIFIYAKTKNNLWTLQDTIVLSSDNNVGFGSVAYISNDGQTIIGRSSFEKDNNIKSVIYVYECNGSQWIQKCKIYNPDNSSTDNLFGMCVGISADCTTMFVGDEAYNENTGRVILYMKNKSNGAWDLNGFITSASINQGDKLGASLYSMGKYMIATSNKSPSSIQLNIFARVGNSWNEISTHICENYEANKQCCIRICNDNTVFIYQHGDVAAINKYVSSGIMFELPLQTSTIEPIINNKYDIGSSVSPYKNIFTSNVVNVTLDNLQKYNVRNCMLDIDFINMLKPVTYNQAQDDDYDHDGLISEDIARVIHPELGIVDKSLAGIRYDEIIAPLVCAIQHIDNKLRALEN